MKVTLSWPDKRLSPNAKTHWRGKLKPKRDARYEALIATFEAAGCGLSEARAYLKGDAPIPVAIRMFPPDGRRRDRDNMQASLKHHLDGIAEALGVDDYRFRPSYEFGEPKAPGRVEISIG